MTVADSSVSTYAMGNGGGPLKSVSGAGLIVCGAATPPGAGDGLAFHKAGLCGAAPAGLWCVKRKQLAAEEYVRTIPPLSASTGLSMCVRARDVLEDYPTQQAGFPACSV